MMPRIAAVMLVAAVTGCTVPAPKAEDVTAGRPWPSARPAAPHDPPQIVAVHLSATRVRLGDTWSGRIATTSNVASLEVRSPSFTFSAPRIAFGQFAFTIHALYIPPLYRRVYTIELIARNAAGVSNERDVDIDFR